MARIEDALVLAERLTLELEAIDLGTDVETARHRLEIARHDPQRPSAEDTNSRLSVESLPWLHDTRDDELSDGDAA